MILVFPNEILINILLYLSINRNLIFPCVSKKLYKLTKKNQEYIWKRILTSNNFEVIKNNNNLSLKYKNYMISFETKPPKLKNIFINHFHKKELLKRIY